MREVEVRQLFLIIFNAYNGFAYDDDKVVIWTDILEDVPFEQAQSNLRRYIRNPENKFPPHPGALAETQTQNAEGPYIPDAEETRRMLNEQDQQYQLTAGAIPDNLREVVRNIGRSKSSTAGNRADESTSTS